MNNQRRQTLRELASILRAAHSRLECARDDEQEAFDNMPEPLQQGDKGVAMQDGIDELQQACDELEGVLYVLDEIAGVEPLRHAPAGA